MAEANHRVHQPQVGAMADVIHLPSSLSSDEVKFAVIVLARRAAREAVKRQLQHAGVRVSLLSCSEIRSRANPYLKAHRSELPAQAALSPRRRTDPKAKSLNDTPVQNGEQK